jgi:hypothetical protein
MITQLAFEVNTWKLIISKHKIIAHQGKEFIFYLM